MDSDALEKQAVQAAIKGTWQKAVTLNRQLIKNNPKNVAALNRLARAYWELDQINEAQKTYRQVLRLDTYNAIALKNLDRLVKKKKKKTLAKKPFVSSHLFLEEPGKTKTIKLIRLASSEVLSDLSHGQPVLLEPKNRNISVLSEDRLYLGTIPDDLSSRLIKLIKGGNRYQAFIKAVDRQQLEIFIRETFRSKRFHNLPSFPSTAGDYLAYLSPEAVYEERPETAPTGEEEE
jgi:hypothetical protein